MKLKGLSLIVPLADLRPLCAPTTRFRFLSPYAAKLGLTRLKGFGAATFRQLPNPLRAAETIYFRCQGAVTLPGHLPDGAGVTRSSPRVYLDSGPTVRFDLSVFTNPRRQGPSSPGTFIDWFRGFWNNDFPFYDQGKTRELKCPSLLKELEWKLVRASTPSSTVRYDLVDLLPPLMIAIVQADDEYLKSPPTPLDGDRTLFSEIRPFTLPRLDQPVTTVVIAHAPGRYLQARHAEFDRLRKARLMAAWLHTDLQVLLNLAQRVHSGQADAAGVIPYVEDITDSLTYVPTMSAEEGLSIIAFSDLYEASVVRGCASLEGLGLVDAARKLRSALESPESRSGTKPRRSDAAGGHSLETPQSNKERASLDPLVTEALNRYARHLTIDGQNNVRYDDGAFRESAIRKAREIASRLPAVGPYVILSIGGADGTELFELMTLTKSSVGVLLEIADRSTGLARAEAKRRGIELVVLTGDANQKIAEAMEAAKRLAADAQGIPILTTIMATLHELPSRSHGFDLLEFFAALRETALLIGREPVEPANWSEEILLSGNFESNTFVKLANEVVVGTYAHWQQRRCKLKS